LPRCRWAREWQEGEATAEEERVAASREEGVVDTAEEAMGGEVTAAEKAVAVEERAAMVAEAEKGAG
jgi:hypothetical protein